MKKTLITLTVLVLSLAACAPAVVQTSSPEETSVPVENQMPVLGVDVTEMVVEPQGKLPAPSFESQLFLDEVNGFAFEYPVGWTVTHTAIGDRGSQSVLLSVAQANEDGSLPAGATRIAVTINQWDPKNDLAAFVETRKVAWDSSGFTILDEEPLTLELGLGAVRLTTQTPDGLTTAWLIAAIGDQYLTLSGEGDLDLAREIMLRLRPIGS